jgi:hypothetical protein
MAAEMSADDADLDMLVPIALPVGAAGLMLGLAEVNEAWDRGVVRFLERTGVPKPRLVLAAGTVAASLGAFALGRLMPTPEPQEQDPRLEAVPSEIRNLVLGMLNGTEGHSSEVLRSQLNQAEVRIWPSEEYPSWVAVDFAVSDDVPLAVPHSFTFPVKAQFRGRNGHLLQALLLIEDGVLDAIVLDTAPGDDSEDDGWPSEHFERWPDLDEVTLVLDSATRSSPSR